MNIDFFGSLPLIVIWLALGAVGIVIQAFVRENTKLVFGYYAGTLAVTALLAVVTSGHKGFAFQDMITVGGYANYFDVLFCGTGMLTMFAARPYLQREDVELDEFYTLLVSSVAGMMLMAHANNLVALFIGIELMSLSFYVLAGFMRKNIRSVEAALKYFLLGAFSTGFLVYGMALVYGSTNSLQYDGITRVVLGGGVFFPALFVIGVTLLTVGLCFKIAAFPFHQWAPDVYEGAPTVVSAYMSTAGKAAAFSAFVPVFAAVMPSGAVNGALSNLPLMVAIIAAITMLIGNITAVAQSNVKRMLAYSSVAHAGYILIGIVTGGTAGRDAVVFYATVYTFMQMGAFVIVGLLERNNEHFLDMKDYAGLHHKQPMLAAMMAMFMFALAGIPPFAGFFGKYLLFMSAIESGYTWLAIVGVASSVISAYFYLGLIVRMYFQDPSGEPLTARPGLAGITLVVCSAAILVLGIFPQVLLNIFHSW